MAKADLHVHSKYSEHPSEWFLQRLGAAESYTEPDEAIYAAAKAREMDLVTITDHNKIDGVLRLKAAHPQDVFTGVEATAYFPEDDCKIHILLFGFSETEFAEIQRARRDIYQLRDYIRDRRLAHSVAHATFRVNGKLALAHLEKLMLLFNVFEGINGGVSNLSSTAALLARMSTRSQRSRAIRRAPRMDGASQTLRSTGWTSPGRLPVARRTASGSRSPEITLAPASARVRQSSAPRSPAAPVTTATLPSRRKGVMARSAAPVWC